MPDAMFPVEMADGVPVIGAPGEIDVTNAGQFRAALLTSAACGSGIIIVDMSRTQFCDSAGLHALVTVYRRVRADGGEVRLVIPDPDILRIFVITGLDRVIACHSDLGRALAPLSPHRPCPTRCA
jgi:anti-sigma B factor antagonist